MSFKRTKMRKFMDFIWIFGTFISIVVFCGGGFNWLLYPWLKFFEHDNDAIFSIVSGVGLIFAYHIIFHIIPKFVAWQRIKRWSTQTILEEISNIHPKYITLEKLKRMSIQEILHYYITGRLFDYE